ncbi:MAG: lipoprotein-releasing ABC transporter permease subunit [Gemmatimonadota bacterium]
MTEGAYPPTPGASSGPTNALRTVPDRGGARLEWFLAHRYLSGSRRKGLLSLITLIAIGGVTVGVMALIVVIGVMTGLQKDLREKILGASPHGMVLEVGSAFRMNAWREVLREVEGTPGVTEAAPFIYSEVLLNAGESYSEGAVLRGIAEDSASLSVGGVGSYLVAGRMPFGPTESGRPGIVVGQDLARRLGLYEGKLVTVLSAAGESLEITPTGFMPQMRRFEVTGIFSTGLFQYDTKFTYVALHTAQELLGLGDAVTGVEFNVGDPWRADAVAREAEGRLGYPYTVDDWQKQNASLFSALKLEKLAMAVILLLIVLVASFNIVSTLVMVVADKTREIGILRSMGLTSRAIMRVFMYQGMVIGLMGTGIGLILGSVLASLLDRYRFIHLPSDVYFVDSLPVQLEPLDLFLIVLASLLISFVATLYPARQAAELAPVEAIRHD